MSGGQPLEKLSLAGIASPAGEEGGKWQSALFSAVLVSLPVPTCDWIALDFPVSVSPLLVQRILPDGDAERFSKLETPLELHFLSHGQ